MLKIKKLKNKLKYFKKKIIYLNEIVQGGIGQDNIQTYTEPDMGQKTP